MGGYWYAHAPSGTLGPSVMPEGVASAAERKILYYRDPSGAPYWSAEPKKDAQGRAVNRCESIAWIGGCTDTNEFNYLVGKTMRSLGVCYLETQARV